MAARIVLAVACGYALAVAVSIVLSFILPMSRVEAVLSGLLISFAVYAAAIIWVFAVRSISRMWIGLGGVTAGFGLLAGLLKLVNAP